MNNLQFPYEYGARGLVEIIQRRSALSKQSIYLYAHDTPLKFGEVILSGLFAAMEEGRADDEGYLTRIIFSHMLGDNGSGWESDKKIAAEVKRVTGYAISVVPWAPEPGTPVIVLDVPKQRFGYWLYSGSEKIGKISPNNWISFKDLEIQNRHAK